MTSRRDRVPPASHRATPAGLLGRLRRSRGGDAGPATIGEQDALAVDRAVRALATACAGAGRAVPAVLAVVVDADTVSLRLAAPDDRPPDGWTAEPHARTWHAASRWLSGAPADASVPAPYPRLVSLGAGGDGFVLFNLGRAGGVVSVDGDADQAGILLDEWARELRTCPWAAGVRVVRAGPRTDADRSADAAADNADAGPRAQATRLGEVEPALAAPDGGVLLFGDRPTDPEADRLCGLADDPAGRWSVVVAGPVEDARWRLTIDRDGTLGTDVLDGPAAAAEPPGGGLGEPAGGPDAPGGTAGIPAPAALPADGTGAAARPAARRRLALLGMLVVCLAIVAIPVGAWALKDRAGGHPASEHGRTSTPASPPPSATPSPSPSPSSSPSPSPSSSPPSSSRSSSRPPSSPPVSSTPATVAPGGTGTVRSVAAGLCVDSDANPAMALNGTPSGGHAFVSACSGARSQQWSEGPLLSQDNPRGDDLYRLVDRQTGFCLDTNQDGSVYTLPCLDPDGYQVWQRVRVEAGTVGYRNQATGRCLNVPGTDPALRTQPCPAGASWPADARFGRLP